jgi:hypothetical protein
VIGVAQSIAVSKKRKAMEEKLKSLHDFSPTQKIMGNDGVTGLAIDEKRKYESFLFVICLINKE